MSGETKFYWGIIATLIGVILFLQKCNNEPKEPSNTTTIIKEQIVYDTVDFPKYIVKEISVKVPTPTVIYDTITKKEVNYYTQDYSDTLLKGNLSAKVDGKLVDWKFNYTPLFPKYITKTVTNSTLITIRDTVESKRLRFFLGLNARVGQGVDYDMYPSLSLYKNNLLFNLGYSPLKNAAEFGVNIKLNRKK